MEAMKAPQVPQSVKDVIEIIQKLVGLEREAAAVRRTRAFQPSNEYPRTLGEIEDLHRALLAEYAKLVIRAAAMGETVDVETLLRIPDSPEPLVIRRARVGAAIWEQLLAWAAAGEMPAPYDAGKFASRLTGEA
jgi:hypothetical protein